MGDLNTQNVAAAKPFGGGIYYAPLGTALPTDASTALPTGYLPLGYLSSDGIKPSRDTNVDKVKAWGGDVVAALLSDESRSFEFTMLEVFSKNVLQFLYGTANVSVTAATTTAGTKTAILDKGGKQPDCVLVFDTVHGGKRRRIIVPAGDYVFTDEGPLVDSALHTYTVQAEAKKDASGVRVYEYTQNDDKLAA